MMLKVYSLYNAEFYLYINGDILLSPSLYIDFMKINIFNNQYRIYGTSDRHNAYIDNYDIKLLMINHNNLYNESKQYTLCGQDAFLTKRNTFNEKQIIILNNLAIGRVKIDNIILGMAIKDKEILTIDFSNIFKVVHLQYHKRYAIEKKDYLWNKYVSNKFKSRLIALACMNKIRWTINSSNNKIIHT